MNEHDNALKTIDPATIRPARQGGHGDAGRPWHLRSDSVHSALVDRGVALQGAAGTVCALEYLRAYNVLPEVIQRVLLHPARRRQVSA